MIESNFEDFGVNLFLKRKQNKNFSNLSFFLAACQPTEMIIINPKNDNAEERRLASVVVYPRSAINVGA